MSNTTGEMTSKALTSKKKSTVKLVNIHSTKKWSFPLRMSLVNPQFPENLITFTGEILNGKPHFLYSDDQKAFEFLSMYL